jgi:hypothetical protein
MNKNEHPESILSRTCFIENGKKYYLVANLYGTWTLVPDFPDVFIKRVYTVSLKKEFKILQYHAYIVYFSK